MNFNTAFNRKERKGTQRDTDGFLCVVSYPEGESSERGNPRHSFVFFASFAVELRSFG